MWIERSPSLDYAVSVYVVKTMVKRCYRLVAKTHRRARWQAAVKVRGCLCPASDGARFTPRASGKAVRGDKVRDDPVASQRLSY